MDNSQGFASLDSMIKALATVEHLAEESAPQVAYAVERELERSIAQGTDPSGKPWVPKKDGSGKPLATAAKALRVVAVGSTVFATLSGHVARHHLGRAKGGVVREILPTSSVLPSRIATAITEVVSKQFTKAVSV